jgi:thiosulfate dehydrogenase
MLESDALPRKHELRVGLLVTIAAAIGLGVCISMALAAEDVYPGWNDAPDPQGPVGEAIVLGRRVLTKTAQSAPAYSGNALNCTSCHLNAGRTPWSSPWVGIWGVFPEYRSRSARVISLQDRINDCFERSMNGKALPPASPEMIGILAYMQWLSREVPTGQSVTGRGFVRMKSKQPPDRERGARVYAQKCAVCHGEQGQGMPTASGEMLYPPLWGPKSFNIGAGMARLNTAAAFVKANMPFDQPGSLSDEEAFDVAAFFTRQPRPDFAGKSADWAQGGKPEDARY